MIFTCDASKKADLAAGQLISINSIVEAGQDVPIREDSDFETRFYSTSL
jgi:hypothetical protein